MWLTKVVELGIGGVGATEFDDAFAHVLGEFVAERAAGYADDGELLGQEAGLKKVIERGEKLALGQVARSAEDDENTGLRDALRSPGNLGEVFRSDFHLNGGHLWITSSGGKSAFSY